MKDLQFNLKKALFKRRLGIAEHRQFQMMEVALELIQKKGFEQLQFGDLAKRCKISRTLVHHYFKDKFDLAHRLLDLSTLHLQNFVQGELDKQKDTKKHFEIYCRATLDWPAQHPMEALGLLLFLHLSSYHLDMRKKNDQLSALGRQKIKTLILQVDQVHPSIDSAAHVIQTLLTGCYLMLLSENYDSKESLRLRDNCLQACLKIAVSK